jgi:hypothetical protein
VPQTKKQWMGGTKQNEILNANQRLWILYIKDEMKKDKIKRHYILRVIQHCTSRNIASCLGLSCALSCL